MAPDAQEPHPLENYCDYNHCRSNRVSTIFTPADVYFGRCSSTTLIEREEDQTTHHRQPPLAAPAAGCLMAMIQSLPLFYPRRFCKNSDDGERELCGASFSPCGLPTTEFTVTADLLRIKCLGLLTSFGPLDRAVLLWYLPELVSTISFVSWLRSRVCLLESVGSAYDLGTPEAS